MYSLYNKFQLNQLTSTRTFKDIYAVTKDFTMMSEARMKMIHKSVVYISSHKLPGDLVECGVWKGGGAMMMVKTLVANKDTTRNIYLYDTYAGMSMPNEEDAEIATGKPAMSNWKKHRENRFNSWSFASLATVKSNMSKTGYSLNKILYIKGKVEKTIPATLPQKISLLHLDTDWYASTYHELQYLYPRVVPGGLVIIDDYGHWTGSKIAVDTYFREHNIPFRFEKIDYSGIIGFK